MNPWNNNNWKQIYSNESIHRSGLRFRYDNNIDSTLKAFLKKFAVWLRCNYTFPVRVNVYIKNVSYIKAKDGDYVPATFLGPYNKLEEPYIKVSAGDYSDIAHSKGVYCALCSVAASVAHELTHYYQWLNNIELSEKQEERQAEYYSKKIVYQYLDEYGYDYLESLGINC
ncbi:MAG: hypothetical protein ACI4J7_07560 [Ruminiclostridium sp.]